MDVPPCPFRTNMVPETSKEYDGLLNPIPTPAEVTLISSTFPVPTPDELDAVALLFKKKSILLPESFATALCRVRIK